MRIEEIRLTWFRGASEKASLQTAGKSIVVYGPNSTGKSSFIDALEYMLTDGRIEHLRHKYSGHYQVRGVRNTHTPEDAIVSAEVLFSEGRSMRVEIQTSGSHEFSGEPDDTLMIVKEWQAAELILRQDGLAKFIEKDKGEKYSALIPLLGLQALEMAADNVRKLQQEAKVQSDYDDLQQQRNEIRERLTEAFGSPTVTAVVEKLGKIWKGYSGAEKPIDVQSLGKRLQEQIEKRIEAAEPDQKLHVLIERLDEEHIGEKLSEAAAAVEQANMLVDELLDVRLPMLEQAQKFLNAIPADEAEVTCPACGQGIETSQFRRHVGDELNTLGDAKKARDAARKDSRSFTDGLKNIKGLLRDELVAAWADQSLAKKSVAAILAANVTSGDTQNVDDLKKLKPHIQVLEQEIKAKLKTAPKAHTQLTDDLAVTRCGLELLQFESLEQSCSRIDELLKSLESCEAKLRKSIIVRTGEVIETISIDVRRLWMRLHPGEQITDIRLVVPSGADKAIDIELMFHGREQPSPRNTLSEGHRNSLGLCIFLALLLREDRKDWPVVLDDVVSSFDREHRGFLVDVLRDEFAERQVIVVTHYREWFNELKGRLPHNRWKFTRLASWAGPSAGIRVINADDTFEEALEQVSSNPALAAGSARGIMDRRLAIIAERLQLPMPFLMEDANDHRMAVDFLNRLISEAPKRLKRKRDGSWQPAVEPLQIWKNAKELLVYWANPPTHGGSGASEECKALIESCTKALEALRCTECGEQVWERDDDRRHRRYCTCGLLRWKYGGPSADDKDVPDVEEPVS